MRKFFLVFILALITSFPLVLGLQITSPKTGFTYVESIQNLSYSLNITNATSCWYTFGMDNYTLTDCDSEYIELPINAGHINVSVFSENITATNGDTVEVWIDNDLTSGKAALLCALMVVFLILPFIFWYVCFKLDNLHTPAKLFLTLLGFFSVYLTLHFAVMLGENFIHIPIINSTLLAISDGYMYMMYTIFLYFLTVFIFSALAFWRRP